MSFIFSANDICRTRLCAAAGCMDDAEHGSALCARCERRFHTRRDVDLRLAHLELPDPTDDPRPSGQTLRCSACRDCLPDDAFPFERKRVDRRGRHAECRQCSSDRRRAQRRSMPPDKLAALRAAELARYHARMKLRRGA